MNALGLLWKNPRGEEDTADMLESVVEYPSRITIQKNCTALDLSKVKSIVVEIGQRPDKEFYPLARYRGGQSIQRIRALLSFVLSMKEANICTTAQICKVSHESRDLIHLQGLHAPVQKNTLDAICSRLVDNQKFLESYKGLREYIYSIPRLWLYHQTRISWTSTDRRCRSWRRVEPKRFIIRQKEEPLFYPFAAQKSTEVQDCELLMAVHEVVPRGLPTQLRGDICQDLIVQILSGDTSFANIQDNPGKYIHALMKEHAGRYGTISLDSKDEDGRSVMEILGV